MEVTLSLFVKLRLSEFSTAVSAAVCRFWGSPTPQALIARAVFYDLVELAEVRDGQFGVWSHGVFFAISSAEAAGVA